MAPDRIERINPKLNAVVTMDGHYWRHHADPDGIERDAAHDEAGRRLHLSPGLRGTGILDGLGPAVPKYLVVRWDYPRCIVSRKAARAARD